MSEQAIVDAFAAFVKVVQEVRGAPMGVVMLMVPEEGGCPELLSTMEDSAELLAFCALYHANADEGMAYASTERPN